MAETVGQNFGNMSVGKGKESGGGGRRFQRDGKDIPRSSGSSRPAGGREGRGVTVSDTRVRVEHNYGVVNVGDGVRQTSNITINTGGTPREGLGNIAKGGRPEKPPSPPQPERGARPRASESNTGGDTTEAARHKRTQKTEKPAANTNKAQAPETTALVPWKPPATNTEPGTAQGQTAKKPESSTQGNASDSKNQENGASQQTRGQQEQKASQDGAKKTESSRGTNQENNSQQKQWKEPTAEQIQGAKNFYDMLGVSKDASPKEIQQAYRKLAQKYHPDNQQTGNLDRMKQLNQAYDTLKDSGKRAVYDVGGEPVPQTKEGKNYRYRASSTGREAPPRVNAQTAAAGELTPQQTTALAQVQRSFSIIEGYFSIQPREGANQPTNAEAASTQQEKLKLKKSEIAKLLAILLAVGFVSLPLIIPAAAIMVATMERKKQEVEEQQAAVRSEPEPQPVAPAVPTERPVQQQQEQPTLQVLPGGRTEQPALPPSQPVAGALPEAA